jgi:hypothetical protein
MVVILCFFYYKSRNFLDYGLSFKLARCHKLETLDVALLCLD